MGFSGWGFLISLLRVAVKAAELTSPLMKNMPGPLFWNLVAELHKKVIFLTIKPLYRKWKLGNQPAKSGSPRQLGALFFLGFF